MNIIDIGLVNYGCLPFLQRCVQSIKDRTEHPFNLYIANNFCPQEPIIEQYLMDLLNAGTIQGAILIRENVFSRAIDLLYEHFLKSKIVVISDADLELPIINYCWLRYLSQALLSEERMAFLSIRPSIINAGTTDESVLRRTQCFSSFKSIFSHYYNNISPHPLYPKIGLYLPTGVFFQTFKKDFLDSYYKEKGQFRHDQKIRDFANRASRRWGCLLEECKHLSWEAEDYPELKHIVEQREKNRIGGYSKRFVRKYNGVGYRILQKDKATIDGRIGLKQ